LAVLEVAEGAFVLKETAPGVTVDEIQQKTQGKLVVPDDVNVMVV